VRPSDWGLLGGAIGGGAASAAWALCVLEAGAWITVGMVSIGLLCGSLLGHAIGRPYDDDEGGAG
jgi:hypothetical protein